MQTELLNSFLRILTSKEYQQTHLEENYDLLLQHTLQFLAAEATHPDIASAGLQKLQEYYGQDSQKGHWQKIAKLNDGSLRSAWIKDQALLSNPLPSGRQHHAHFEAFLQSVDIDPNKLTDFYLRAGAELHQSNLDQVEAHVKQLVEASPDQGDIYTNVFLELGREIRDDITKNGISRVDGHQDEHITFDHWLYTRSLQLGGPNNEIPKVARKAYEMAFQLNKQVEAVLQKLEAEAAFQGKNLDPERFKVRIICGSFPGVLALTLGRALHTFAKNSWIDPEKIVWTYFNLQTKEFYDTSDEELNAYLQEFNPEHINV